MFGEIPRAALPISSSYMEERVTRLISSLMKHMFLVADTWCKWFSRTKQIVVPYHPVDVVTHMSLCQSRNHARGEDLLVWFLRWWNTCSSSLTHDANDSVERNKSLYLTILLISWSKLLSVYYPLRLSMLRHQQSLWVEDWLSTVRMHRYTTG